MNRIFPLSVCFYIIQNQGYSIKCLIKKFPAMLEREIWGNTLEDWGISILIILGTIVLMKLISFFSRKVLNPFITRTNNRLDDIIYYSLESPVKFAIMLLGIWIAIHRLVSPDSFVKVIDNAYKILIILDITWIFARLSSSLLQIYWGTTIGWTKQQNDAHYQTDNTGHCVDNRSCNGLK